MKTQSPPQSGKLGDLVASRNHYGYYLRRRPSVLPKPTPARRRSQRHFRSPIADWNTLPDATRQGWNLLAKHCKS